MSRRERDAEKARYWQRRTREAVRPNVRSPSSAIAHFCLRIIAIATLIPLPSARAQGLSQIYVYAQLETPARSWLPISCDSTVVAKLKPGRFFAFDVAPGGHILSYEKGLPAFVEARSGEESFVRLDWRVEIGRPAIPVLQVVPPAHARNEMIYLTYIDAGKVLSRSVPRADPRELPQPRLRRRSETDDE